MANLEALTEQTRGVARWLVEQNRSEILPEEFHIMWYGGGYHISGLSRTDDDVPYVGEGALRSLIVAGFLVGYQNQPATMICTMLGTLFTAVDSDFTSSAQEQSAHRNTTSSSVNITIQDSRIGILNTGQIEDVKSISVNISNLNQSGYVEIAQALKILTENVAESQEITSEQRSFLLENLEELSVQASLETDRRAKPGVIKSIIAGIAMTIATAGSLAEVWSTWGATITKFFGV